MHDARKIALGLAGFVAVAALPIWLALAGGRKSAAPQIELPKDGRPCVEPGEFMRAQHMLLLSQWRDAAVRDGRRVYVSSRGDRHDISLTGTCMGCHANAATFCDRCHDYTGVKPDCWDCHNKP